MKLFGKNGETFFLHIFHFVFFRYAGKGEISFSDPSSFPEIYDVETFLEPIVNLTIIVPLEYLNTVSSLCSQRRGERGDVSFIDNDRVLIKSKMPLNEIIVDFFEQLKKLTRLV